MVNKVACITVALVASLASAGVTEAAAGTHAKGFGSLCALLVDAESAPGIAAAAAKETAEAVRSAIEEAERHANALLGDAATMSLGQAAVKLLGGSVTRAGKETRANFSCDEGIAEGTNGSICALQRMAKSAQQEAKSVAAGSAQALLGGGRDLGRILGTHTARCLRAGQTQGPHERRERAHWPHRSHRQPKGHGDKPPMGMQRQRQWRR
ncbi:hypothetical protein TRVL_09837 [Trypanosoma vivax]|nr:hypothetical protein TRVL_09837 [Trypanosoma vivax]